MSKPVKMNPVAEGKLLPPDPEEMNDARAEWASDALEVFRHITGADEEDALADLLCDLMHYADRHDTLASGSFPIALRRAREHYREETGGRGTQSANFD